MYRFFDLCIESELPLPGLAGCGAQRADWTVALLDGGGDAAEPEWFHSWRAPAGEALMTAGRRGASYVLGFPGLARFTIDFEARLIAALPLADCSGDTLAHLLLDQVLPRAVCHQGRMVVHASAVDLGEGRAVAFTGVSGRGKSTLAAAFHRAGHAVLADDCVLLQPDGDRVACIPAYASLRLWPASADALFTREDQARLHASRMAHYTEKRVFPLRPEPPAGQAAQLPLQALVLLEPPDPDAADEEIRIEPAAGMSAIMALVEAQFALDVVERGAVQRNFAVVSAVAARVRMFRLGFPRNYSRLEQVLEIILGMEKKPIGN